MSMFMLKKIFLIFTVILPSGVPVYVDPTTYQDLADAVREFSKELDRQWIQLERLIGGGKL